MHSIGVAVALAWDGSDPPPRELSSMTGCRARAYGRKRLVSWSQCSRAEGTLHREPKVTGRNVSNMERTGDEAPHHHLRWKKVLRLCCHCHGPHPMPIGNTLMDGLQSVMCLGGGAMTHETSRSSATTVYYL